MDDFMYPDPSLSDMQATTTVYIYLCVPLRMFQASMLNFGPHLGRLVKGLGYSISPG